MAFINSWLAFLALGLPLAQGWYGSRSTLDELLSYQCAQVITSLVSAEDQIGPVFAEGPLVFSSVEAQGGQRLLIVSGGNGFYSLPLASQGVNRIRFELHVKGTRRVFYISYVHGANMPSRYFEFSALRPPIGRDELDYTNVKPVRAEALLSHVEYGVHETAENILSAVKDGRLSRDQLNVHKPVACEHLARRSPAVAKTLQRNLDVLQMVVSGPQKLPGQAGGGRMPASVAAPASAPGI